MRLTTFSIQMLKAIIPHLHVNVCTIARVFSFLMFVCGLFISFITYHTFLEPQNVSEMYIINPLVPYYTCAALHGEMLNCLLTWCIYLPIMAILIHPLRVFFFPALI